MMTTDSAAPANPDSQPSNVVAATKGKQHFGAKMILSVLIMCMGTTTYSYNAGVIASTIGQPSFYAYMGLDQSSHTTALIGATTALYYAGGIFGACAANVAADLLGRKMALYIGTFVSLAAVALTAGSVHISMFIVFRFFAGFGGFMLFVCVPLWITEVVPPEVRGAFAQFHGVFTSLGYMLSSYVGVGFYTNKSIQALSAWRGPLAIGVLPPLLFLTGLWWVPESPRFLLMKGRTDQAWDIIRRFHSKPGEDDTRYVEAEVFQMRNQIELDRTLPSSWTFMFRTPSMRKRMWMTVFIVFAVLSSGNLSIATFATIILSHTGWDPLAQLNIQAGMIASVIPGLLAAIWFTEKFRRPTMMATGLAGLCVLLSVYTAIAASMHLADGGHRVAQIGGVVILYLYQIWGCAWSEGPLAYWAAEFYPTHLRARGQTITVVSYGAFSILWGQCTPTAIANLGWKFFLVFICITFVTTNVIYWYFPDTQGKTLEEIALLFGDDDLVVVRQQDIHIDANHHITAKMHNKVKDHAMVENVEEIKEAA
jgi:sugar porter (SP) family MFS transporter